MRAWIRTLERIISDSAKIVISTVPNIHVLASIADLRTGHALHIHVCMYMYTEYMHTVHAHGAR